MARVNIGVDPKLLADQHLIAESVEITMITGQLKKAGYTFKADVPSKFRLGKGHITFFKNKLAYLNRRLQKVNEEMQRRGFNPGTTLDDVMEEAPAKLINEWQPSMSDSKILRERIASRLSLRTRGQKGQGYYRYCGEYIPDVKKFSERMLASKLYCV